MPVTIFVPADVPHSQEWNIALLGLYTIICLSACVMFTVTFYGKHYNENRFTITFYGKHHNENRFTVTFYGKHHSEN